jgi:hypothetical protein
MNRRYKNLAAKKQPTKPHNAQNRERQNFPLPASHLPRTKPLAFSLYSSLSTFHLPPSIHAELGACFVLSIDLLSVDTAFTSLLSLLSRNDRYLHESPTVLLLR